MVTTRKQLFLPERGDIVWIQHDPQAGREMKGMHPMLIISPRAFDWGVRGGGRHPWAAAPAKVLREALNRLDSICGICENRTF